MRFNFSARSRSEDRFEQWIAQQHQQRVLEGDVAASGPCPDEAFLEKLARHSERLSLSDPRIVHVTTCPACTQRIILFRQKQSARRRNLALATGVASVLLIAAAIFFLGRHRGDINQQALEAPSIPQTVDLWNAGTYRGSQAGQLQSVSLPTGLVKVTVILPRYSEPGRYSVAVTRDQTGRDVVAVGSADARGDRERVQVSVLLDLRKSSPGAYFLSTTHERDQASYYYPLQIR